MNQVLADGLSESLDWRDNGAKLSPEEWHAALERAIKAGMECHV